MENFATTDNTILIELFVSRVGYDYSTQDYDGWPEWSDITKELWEELEHRLEGTRKLRVDYERLADEINEELKIQRQIVSNGNNAIVSYHAGICSGLNIALKLLEANTRSVDVENGK